jgi:hypothetical protein
MYCLGNYKEKMTAEQLAVCLEALGRICEFHKMSDQVRLRTPIY